MSIDPVDWSVVVVGRWNRAILTPAGIAKRLFGLEEGTPVEVFVPLDAIAPYKVQHEKIQIIAGSDRLMVEPVDPTWEGLDRSKSKASIAIEALPETPLTAAGVNVKFAVTEPDEALIKLISHETDVRLSDAGFDIKVRSQKRTVEWGEGRINIFVEHDLDELFQIHLNYDLIASDVDRLKIWLDTPIDEFRTATRRVLEQYIGVSPEEIGND